MNWQPIETAPKDGTEFLAYDSATKKFDVCIMENWRVGPGQSQWICSAVQIDGENGPLSSEFGYDDKAITHWMPLPEPPC